MTDWRLTYLHALEMPPSLIMESIHIVVLCVMIQYSLVGGVTSVMEERNFFCGILLGRW
jgi:hypothetical protein